MTTTLDKVNDDFRDVLLAFADGGVEFVLVGAYALALHGVPRATYIGREAFLRNKEATGRAKDAADASRLRRG